MIAHYQFDPSGMSSLEEGAPKAGQYLRVSLDDEGLPNCQQKAFEKFALDCAHQHLIPKSVGIHAGWEYFMFIALEKTARIKEAQVKLQSLYAQLDAARRELFAALDEFMREEAKGE